MHSFSTKQKGRRRSNPLLTARRSELKLFLKLHMDGRRTEKKERESLLEKTGEHVRVRLIFKRTYIALSNNKLQLLWEKSNMSSSCQVAKLVLPKDDTLTGTPKC